MAEALKQYVEIAEKVVNSDRLLHILASQERCDSLLRDRREWAKCYHRK